MNNKPVYTSLYRFGYASAFLSLIYYGGRCFATIMLLLLICHFADAARSSGLSRTSPFLQPCARPRPSVIAPGLVLQSLRLASSFSPCAWPRPSAITLGPFSVRHTYEPAPANTLRTAPFLSGPPAKMEQNPLLNRRYTCKGINKKVKKTTKAFYFFTFFEAVDSFQPHFEYPHDMQVKHPF